MQLETLSIRFNDAWPDEAGDDQEFEYEKLDAR